MTIFHRQITGEITLRGEEYRLPLNNDRGMIGWLIKKSILNPEVLKTHVAGGRLTFETDDKRDVIRAEVEPPGAKRAISLILPGSLKSGPV